MSESKRKALAYRETITVTKPHNYVSAQEAPSGYPAPIVRRQRDHNFDASVIAEAAANLPTTIYIDNALRVEDGSIERTNGMERSKALVVRLLPFSVIWLILAVGISWAASMGGAFTFITFAGLTAVTYAYLDRQEREFSRNGLERHKVNTLADLKLAEMDHQQELRRMALETTLKMIERRDPNDY